MTKSTSDTKAGTVRLLDSQSFRHALGHFPTGVAIVTTRNAEGNPIGLTINSFASLSLNPPLISWGLANNSPNLNTFQQCHYFAINVLSQTQVDKALQFANSKVKDKFALISHTDGEEGVPLIDDCVATFVCKNHNQHREGDHTLFIGQVVHHSTLTHHAPAIFHRGQFTQLNESGN